MSQTWLRILFWAYLLFLVWADATAYNPADPDLWHRLALGEALLQTHHFPPGEAFSYLADYHDVADHEWGSAVIFYTLYQLGGGVAVVLMKLLTLVVTIVLLVWAGTCRRRFNFFYAPLYALVLLALLPSFQSTVRCMTFTHILFALWLYWYQLERQGRPIPIAWYLLSIVVWANLHGGFAIGLAWLLGLAAMEAFYSGPSSRSCRTWLLRFGVCSLATLVNPFGFYLWISTLRALITPRTGFNEWAPVAWWPDVLGYGGYKILLLAVIGIIIVQIARRGWRQVDQRAVMLLVAAGALACTSARHTSLFAAVAGALLPGLLSSQTRISDIAHPFQRLMAMGAWLALFVTPFYCALIILPGDVLTLRYAPDSCPVAAVQYLKDKNVQGKLLVPFNYGSYALWELRGQMRVSMDGRYDLVYRPATYRRVEGFFDAKDGGESLLTSPKPDAILVPKSDNVYPKLKALPDWHEATLPPDSPDAVFLPQISS